MSTAERALGGPEIEVVAKATQRRFTLECTRRIVQEADRCKTPGAVGALLRREGLYSSHLATWRAARDRGEFAGVPKKRGPAPQPLDPRDKRIAELKRETARWQKRAERAEALGEVKQTGPCWGRRSSPSAPDSHRDGGRAPAWHRADMRGARAAAGDLLPTQDLRA